MTQDNSGRGFVVTLGGAVWVDTTVAVVAETEEAAARMALQGVQGCPSE